MIKKIKINLSVIYKRTGTEMKKFLKQLGLSDDAIELYLNILSKSPLTFYEIKSILPNELTHDAIKEILAELDNKNLIVQLKPDSTEILPFYYSIPPISPILGYYKNINENLPNINEQIKNLLTQTLDEIFEKDNPVKLDSLLENFNSVYKDLDEKYLIQKHDVRDLVEEIKEIKKLMEIIPKIKDIFNSLHDRVRGISQTQFAKLIKILKRIRKRIVSEVKKLEMRKHEEEIIEIVEDIFKEKLQEMVDDFTNELADLIEEEFNNIPRPVDNKIKGPLEGYLNQAFNQLDEMQTLYFNTIEGFKDKLEEIKEVIVKNDEKLNGNLKKLKEKISAQFNEVVLESLTNVTHLSKPIQNVLKGYYESMLTPDAFTEENLWKINSITHINEEIFQIVKNTKDQVTLIVPKLEHHLNLEMFQNVDQGVIFKIAAGDPHTNSKVKKYKEQSNISYRQLSNKTVIAVQGDDNHVLIAVKNPDSEEILNNCMGIGTNYKPLIKVLASAIHPIWKSAKGEEISGPKVGTKPTSMFQRERPQLKSVGSQSSRSRPAQQSVQRTTPSKKTTMGGSQTDISPSEENSTHPREETKPEQQKAPLSSSESTSATTQQQESQTQPFAPKQTAQQGETSPAAQPTENYTSKVQPDPSNSVAVAINNAFNQLLQNLNTMNGIQFSSQLENVADIILEQKGFSTALHNIRKWINSYKNKKEPLSEQDKSQIFSAIETWKQRIFT